MLIITPEQPADYPAGFQKSVVRLVVNSAGTIVPALALAQAECNAQLTADAYSTVTDFARFLG